jgi:hypothetical protein
MQDQRGNVDEEDEEIDWGQDYMADDLAMGNANDGVEDASDDESEEGPTFGNVDLGDISDEDDLEAGDLDDVGMHSNNGKNSEVCTYVRHTLTL